MLRNTAERSRGSRRNLWAAHSLAAEQLNQILIGKLSDKGIQGDFPFVNIPEFIPLVTGLG